MSTEFRGKSDSDKVVSGSTENNSPDKKPKEEQNKRKRNQKCKKNWKKAREEESEDEEIDIMSLDDETAEQELLRRYEEDLLAPFSVRRVQPSRRAKELQVSYVAAIKSVDAPYMPTIPLASDETLSPSPLSSSDTWGDEFRDSVSDDPLNASFEKWFASIWNSDLV